LGLDGADGQGVTRLAWVRTNAPLVPTVSTLCPDFVDPEMRSGVVGVIISL